MDKDIRWKQRFENLGKALKRFRETLKAIAIEPDNSIYQIALIGAFQFTYELSWKTMKDYLFYNGIEVGLPREVLKKSFQYGLLPDGQIWIDMLEDRNLMAHVYKEEAAIEAVNKIIKSYAPALEQFYTYLLQKK